VSNNAGSSAASSAFNVGVANFVPGGQAFTPTITAPAFVPTTFVPDAPKPVVVVVPEPVKKTDLEVHLEKIGGGEDKAKPLIELITKFTADKCDEENFLASIIDAISEPSTEDSASNVSEDVMSRGEPEAKSL
jgi:hypothetical protein